MQAAAARVGRSRLQPVLRGLAFGAGLAARVVTAVFGGMVVIAGVFFVGMSIADAVAERSRTRKKRSCHPYALMGQWYRTSSSHEEAPAPAAPPPCRAIEPFPPPPRRAVAPFFDTGSAIAAWLQECEAAGIKHRMHQSK
jgi:hypothetical protein